jgi:hypothetical protein
LWDAASIVTPETKDWVFFGLRLFLLGDLAGEGWTASRPEEGASVSALTLFVLSRARGLFLGTTILMARKRAETTFSKKICALSITFSDQLETESSIIYGWLESDIISPIHDTIEKKMKKSCKAKKEES